MRTKTFVIALSFGLCAGFPAWADDEEMKTETKGTGAAPTLPAENSGKLPPPAKAPSAADHALRAKVRKKAPFWIDDQAHGAAIRLNKDGTFSSEAQGGGSIAGSWKVVAGTLLVQWTDAGDKYSYALSGGKTDLLIGGKKESKGRYNLN